MQTDAQLNQKSMRWGMCSVWADSVCSAQHHLRLTSDYPDLRPVYMCAHVRVCTYGDLGVAGGFMH